MVYLDYSATTKTSDRVLEEFNRYSKEYFANANSTHALGIKAEKAVSDASDKILKSFGSDDHDVIYTSGATESNNLAIKGIAIKNMTKGKHIITTPFEHSSVVSCFNYLAKKGFQVDICPVDEYGLIDLFSLEEMLTDETVLVSVAAINSETGLKQDIAKIGDLLKKYSNTYFHSDMTQAIGKTDIDISNVDLVSFTAHKLYGIKGVGALLVRKGIKLEPIIHGGKSTTIYRAGTPMTPLVMSLAFTLEEALADFEDKINHIKEIHEYLLKQLEKIECAHINSNKYSIPQIVNVSFTKIMAHDLQKYLSDMKIYISTQTACASEKSFSTTIKQLTGSDLFAETSVRISLSHLTTKTEIDILIKTIKEAIDS